MKSVWLAFPFIPFASIVVENDSFPVTSQLRHLRLVTSSMTSLASRDVTTLSSATRDVIDDVTTLSSATRDVMTSSLTFRDIITASSLCDIIII